MLPSVFAHAIFERDGRRRGGDGGGNRSRLSAVGIVAGIRCTQQAGGSEDRPEKDWARHAGRECVSALAQRFDWKFLATLIVVKPKRARVRTEGSGILRAEVQGRVCWSREGTSAVVRWWWARKG